MPIFSNLIVRIGATTDDFDKKVNSSLNKIKRFGADVSAAGQAVSIGFSLPLIAAGGFALKAAADMEKLSMSLGVVSGGSAKAAVEMEKLKELAKLPGLGLEEAVKGSVRLQMLGTSANKARLVMGELGNALAIAGGGKADFAEVVRQLSQLQATGKVTKENLDPIVERIPQIAKLMLDTFGPQSVADPAKFFDKAGINSAQFIDIITEKLSQGARAGNTFQNSMDNMSDSAAQAAAEFGKVLLPIAQSVLDDFLTPAIEKAKALAAAFKELDQPTRQWALGLTAVATAAPIVVLGAGMVAEKAAILAGVLNKSGITASGFGAALGVVALALKSLDEALIIYEKLKETAYQFERLTGIVFSAQGDIHKFNILIANLKENFPRLSETVRNAYDAIKKLSDAVTLPGFALFKAALDAINTATAAATGRSQEMDDSIKALNVNLFDRGQQTNKLVLANKFLHGADIDLISSGNGVAVATGAAGEAAKKHSDIIKVSSVAQLIYVESLERVKVAVGKVKDVMYEWSIAGTIIGKQLETARDPMEEMALATEMYRKELQLLVDVTKNVQAIQKPFSFPELPKAQEPFPNLPGNKNISMKLMFGGMDRQFADRFKTSSKVAKESMHQVSLVVNDLAKGITDVIFKGGKIGDMFKNVAMQAAQSITRLLIEGALKKLADKLISMSGLMAGVFGGAGAGAATAAATAAAASGAGAAAGGVASASSGIGAAAAAANPMVAMVTAVASVVSAISAVVANFQFAAMNKSLDLIEKSTRYTQIYTGEQGQSILWSTQTTAERLNYVNATLDGISLFASEMLGNLQQINQKGGMGGGATVVNIAVNGGDTRAVMEQLTRLLKQQGVVPSHA